MDKCSIIKLLNGAAVVRKVCGIIMTLKQVLDALDSCGLEYSCSAEYESETEYVKALLQRICESEGETNDRFNQANILKMIYCHPYNTEQDLKSAHECMVSSYKAPKTMFLLNNK